VSHKQSTDEIENLKLFSIFSISNVEKYMASVTESSQKLHKKFVHLHQKLTLFFAANK
jgi:hypothetical protein